MTETVRTYGTLAYQEEVAGVARAGWMIEAEPHVTIRLKRTFPRMAQTKNLCTLLDTPEVCRELSWFLERFPLELSDADRLRLLEGDRQHRAREALIGQIVAGKHVCPELGFAVPLREYQLAAAELAVQTRHLLLADDVGIGKTASSFGLLARANTRPALIVTLTHLPKQWERELNRFLPKLSTHVIRQGPRYDLRGVRRTRYGPTGALPDVVITSYSKLAGWRDRLAEVGFVTVVFDEVQELRHMKSDRYSAAEHVAAPTLYRLGLSATPIANLGSEMYSLYNVLAPDALGSRAEFIREWCTAEDNRGRASLTDPVAFGTYLRAQGLMLRRTRKEVGRELPGLTKVIQDVDWDEEELQKIEKPAAELARIILRRTGADRFARMQAAEQLSILVRQATGISKALPVADFVRLLVESGERVLLYGYHRAVYDLWLERLKDYAPAMFTGSESTSAKDRNAERFINGSTPVLIMSLRAGAGLDGLQYCCRTVVFGELDYTPAVMEQCVGRPYRDGQKEPVVAYYCLSGGGSDPVMSDILAVKREQLDGIRDPGGELLEKLEMDGGHVRRLAETYIDKAAP